MRYNFIAVDCGAIPKELAASEFFGHLKGSFTGAISDKTGYFEAANGGTIFLDEIGNLSYENQIQIDINSKALDDFFGNSGILWKNEIYSTTKNEFMSRYNYLDKSNGEKLEYLYSTYLTLNKNNSQLP